MNTTVEPDKHNRIVLTRDVREAAGISSGDTLKLTAMSGRIVLEIEPESRGRIVRKGKLKMWTGKVPATPIEEVVRQVRRYQRG